MKLSIKKDETIEVNCNVLIIMIGLIIIVLLQGYMQFIMIHPGSLLFCVTLYSLLYLHYLHYGNLNN